MGVVSVRLIRQAVFCVPGLLDNNWRIRCSSIQLLGDLLFCISGQSGKMSTESAEDDNFGTEAAQQAITNALGEERRNRMLAGLYMGRSDVALLVRQTALHVWKVVVTNTARTLREILPTLITILLGCLASDNHDKRLVVEGCLWSVVCCHHVSYLCSADKWQPALWGTLFANWGSVSFLKSFLYWRQACSPLMVVRDRGSVWACLRLCSRPAVSTCWPMLTPYCPPSAAPCVTLSQMSGLLLLILLTASTQLLVSSCLAEAERISTSWASPLGQKVLEEVLKPLLERLQGDEEKERVLDGLQQVMAVKSHAVLPMMVPQLVTPPVNTRALATLASVAGPALHRHLTKVIPALVGAAAENSEEVSPQKLPWRYAS